MQEHAQDNRFINCNEMYSQQPKASEVYDIFSDLIKGEFNIYTKKDNDKPHGRMIFQKPLDKIVELFFNKKDDSIYSIVMYNDTTNASRRFAETIEGVDSKTSEEIATEIYNYLESISQE